WLSAAPHAPGGAQARPVTLAARTTRWVPSTATSCPGPYLSTSAQPSPARANGDTHTGMARSQWHKFYAVDVAAPPAVLFPLLADMPNYGQWLPGSDDFGHTTDVEPYPVQCGSRYHDGKPGVAG